MKTIKINVYTLHELNKIAQTKAFETWQNDNYYPFADENEATLTAFCELFGIVCSDWGYDEYTYHFNYHLPDDNITELCGLRLHKYIINNYDKLFSPKVYFNKNNPRKRRESRIFKMDYCVLTGYYIDYNILYPIYDFLRSPRNTDIEHLIDLCLNGFFATCSNDLGYSKSFGRFIEYCGENNIMFYENGEIYY